MANKQPRPQRFPIVGIGASAGGLEALDELFDHLPADTGMAFVVVTHQHPGRTSLLPELLARETEMTVVPVTDGTQVLPNHVYVATPGGHLAIRGGTLRRIEDDTQSVRLPIDSFFRSLAEDQKEHAICIVLSGTGSDGTLGLKAIKAESGMAMVQQSHSAKYASMPASAEATGLADYVLAPAEMPAQLVAYARGPYLSGARTRALSARAVSARDASSLVIAAAPMARLLQLLRTHTGHDFSGYKVNTIQRRIERRMNVHQLNDPLAYVSFLEQNPHEISSLFNELLISVTRFFRDPDSWQAFAAGPLPQLMRSLGDNASLRAWVPGCATGEEVYTLAMVLRECAEQLGVRLHYQIFGTDLDIAAVELARTGRFPAGIGMDVSPERLERFFTHDDGHYSVSKEIREMAIFAPQNLIKDPPFTKLDIISCRNLLIYLGADLQKHVIPIFHYALKPGGLLMLGGSETTGSFADLFEPVDKKWKFYRRKETSPAIHRVPEMPHLKNLSELNVKAIASGVAEVRQTQVAILLERLALDRYCPTFVVVNARGDLVHVHGRTGDYFELAEGQPRANVLDMAREGLPQELVTLIRLASAGEGEVIHDNVRVKTNGDYTVVQLAAKKITQPEAIGGLIFISFRPVEKTDETATPPSLENAATGGQDSDTVLRELQFLRETHQATLQELETSNEELKSANEELQSTNEELQSTNEELETSKEELQSLNEELTTVNAELQSKVDELTRANDDMQNLLNSTDIATIFLDDDLQINRFTMQATRIVALRPSDVGRPLGDLNSKLQDVDLVADCKAVLNTLEHKKRRVETLDGTWYLMRILPYRTTNKVVDGLVLTFVNIQDLKDAEKSGELRSYFEAIFDTVRQPLLVLDERFAVVSANRYFCNAFRLAASEVVGRSLYEIGGQAWNIATLRELLEEILPQNTTFDDFEMEREFPNVGRKKYVLNARRLGDAIPFPGRVLLAMQEVSE